MGKKLVSLLRNLLIMSLHKHIATVVEEQLHIPSYQNASVHMCTYTIVSEQKSPWHFVGSLVSQTDETR